MKYGMEVTDSNITCTIILQYEKKVRGMEWTIYIVL